MESPTPKISLLLHRCLDLHNELTKSMNRLVRQLDKEDCLILQPAVHNIVDRKKEKERHKKQWKVTLKEIIDTGIDYDTLE